MVFKIVQIDFTFALLSKRFSPNKEENKNLFRDLTATTGIKSKAQSFIKLKYVLEFSYFLMGFSFIVFFGCKVLIMKKTYNY